MTRVRILIICVTENQIGDKEGQEEGNQSLFSQSTDSTSKPNQPDFPECFEGAFFHEEFLELGSGRLSPDLALRLPGPHCWQALFKIPHLWAVVIQWSHLFLLDCQHLQTSCTFTEGLHSQFNTLIIMQVVIWMIQLMGANPAEQYIHDPVWNTCVILRKPMMWILSLSLFQRRWNGSLAPSCWQGCVLSVIPASCESVLLQDTPLHSAQQSPPCPYPGTCNHFPLLQFPPTCLLAHLFVSARNVCWTYWVPGWARRWQGPRERGPGDSSLCWQ